MEQEILAAAIKSREAYNTVMVTDHHQDLSDVGKAIWSLITEFYERDPECSFVNATLLTRRAEQVYPGHSETMQGLISTLSEDGCPGNLKEILLDERRQVLRQEMTMRLLENKDEDFDSLLVEFRSLDTEHVEEQTSYLGTSPDALCAAVGDGERIPLAPPALNEQIQQGLLRGHHAIVFGRPESGKSLFAINCLVAASRAGFTVGYIENEDPIVATQLRTVQCITGRTEAEIQESNGEVSVDLNEAGWYDRIHFKDAASMSIPQIARWVTTHDIDFCVVNQLPGVRVKSDNRVLELDAIARGLRGIAKGCNVAILSVIQAGDSGDQKRILKMGDVDYSNTAVQAACDLLIGFGIDDDLEADNQRVLSLCKNKMSGSHDAIKIRVNPSISQID